MVTVIGPTLLVPSNMTGQRGNGSQNRHPHTICHSHRDSFRRQWRRRLLSRSLLLQISRPIATNQDICSSSDFREMMGPRMGQGYRRIFGEEQLCHRFSNDIGTTNHDCSLPSRSIPYFFEHLHDPSRGRWHHNRFPAHKRPIFNGWKPSGYPWSGSMAKGPHPHRYA